MQVTLFLAIILACGTCSASVFVKKRFLDNIFFGNLDHSTRHHGNCHDTIPNCDNYEGDVCHSPKYLTWTLAHCRKFCGLCHLTTTSAAHPHRTTLPGLCQDMVPYCHQYDPVTFCSSPAFQQFAATNCAQYCNFCPSSTTPTPRRTLPTTIPSTTTTSTTGKYVNCVDTFNYCAGEGPNICTQYPKFAADRCPAYCGFCTPDSTTASTPSPTIRTTPTPTPTPTTTSVRTSAPTTARRTTTPTTTQTTTTPTTTRTTTAATTTTTASSGIIIG